ncbi:MAG: hypothetical protein RIR18_2471, partial [Pseudomonadota bacterium]
QQLVHQNGERLFVTSIDISNRFGKQHKDVLRAIENLDCSLEFGQRNFAPSSYNNSQNKAQPMYEITRDGFTFLCMGFTGPQAALWKERYITAFNEMEMALRASPPAHRHDLDLAREVGALRDQLNQQTQLIIGLFERVDNSRRGHIRALSLLNSHREREQKHLASLEKVEARESILELEAEGVPRAVISQRTGRTLNHIRQVIWQHNQTHGATHEGQMALGGV